MNIACISDMHERYNFVKEWPVADVLVVAGDITVHGTLSELARFANLLRTLLYPYVVVVAGNHDRSFEHCPSTAVETLVGEMKDRVFYLQDSGVEIEGVKFWGSPWQLRYGNYAFNIDRDSELKRYWDMVPTDTNVLVTHSPPAGILDSVEEEWWKDGKPVKVILNRGSDALLKTVKSIKPQAHIFGHIHEGYGTHKEDGTTFVNAALCKRGNLTPIQVIQV